MSRRQRQPPPCCVSDLVDCFEDFVKKSLIFISLVVCTVAALLIYVVKIMLDKSRRSGRAIAQEHRDYRDGTQDHSDGVRQDNRTSSVKQTTSSCPTLQAKATVEPSPPSPHCPPPTTCASCTPCNIPLPSPPCSPPRSEVRLNLNLILNDKKSSDVCKKVEDCNFDNDDCELEKPRKKDSCNVDSSQKQKLPCQDPCGEDSSRKDPCEKDSGKKKTPSSKCKDPSDDDSKKKKKKSTKKCKDSSNDDSCQEVKAGDKKSIKKKKSSQKCKDSSEEDICQNKKSSKKCNGSSDEDLCPRKKSYKTCCVDISDDDACVKKPILCTKTSR